MARVMYSMLLLSLLSTTALADSAVTPAQQQGILDKLAPSLVQVEYYLQFDKGQPPAALGWQERCPNCGQFHGDSRGEELVNEQRPLEVGGFVLAANRVLIPDPMIHPRFIKDILIRLNNQTVSARPVFYAARQKALILESAENLPSAQPLQFQPAADDSLFAVTFSRLNGQWARIIQPLSIKVTSPEWIPPYSAVPSHCLITDKNGAPLGMSMSEELPLDDSWKGSPLDWPKISVEEMAQALALVQQQADNGLVRVTLNFRSPQAKSMMSRMSMDDEEEEGSTERNVVGIVCGEKTVLVIANLKSPVTARLEKITVHTAAGEAVPARFQATLADYGCLIAETDTPFASFLKWPEGNILEYHHQLLLTAEIIIQGEKRLGYYQHQRIPSFTIGWKQHLYPEIPGEEQNLFFFDRQGNLLAAPLVRREKVSEQESYNTPDPVLTALNYVKQDLDHLAQSIDPSNVPLTEQEENRLAWLGIELQALNTELARANQVSELTHDGETGALVSYVYPDSPAALAGIEAGFVLVRLHVEGLPKPLDVKVEESYFSEEPFPWDQLDQIPEQYFDQIPQPWPPALNSFTRALTDIGFGKKFTAEFFHAGQPLAKEFQVVESPAYYDSAPRYKSDALGLTLRDLTYEVRHYFQLTPADPSLIVSKIETGEKASVAGIKPYEIITHVNDQPVSTVADFEKNIQNQPELRLSVKRMTRGRVVQIKMD